VRRELWFVAPFRAELREGVAVPLGAGQVRARALASGVSQGTELLLFKGEGPTPFDPSLDPPGAPMYPRRYGYAWIGEVVESKCPTHPVGARVFALLPHGDEHVLNGAQARLLPNDIPAERAVLAPSLETAVNVVWDAGIALGDDVLVIGGGSVGLLVGWLAKRSGAAHVRLLEPATPRRAAALALGIDEAVPPETPGTGADVVIEASGDPSCLERAITEAREEGTIVVASFYGERAAPVPLGSAFHRRRLTLRSSQVSRLPPSRTPGWSFERRFALVTELLKNPALDGLLETATPFDSAPATYTRLAADPGVTLQTVFSYVR